jgi:hypothetical protein
MPERGGTLLAAQWPADPVALDELNVLGVRSSPNAYPAVTSVLALGATRTEPLTADRYPLAGAAAGFDALARWRSIRPIVTR